MPFVLARRATLLTRTGLLERTPRLWSSSNERNLSKGARPSPASRLSLDLEPVLITTHGFGVRGSIYIYQKASIFLEGDLLLAADSAKDPNQRRKKSRKKPNPKGKIQKKKISHVFSLFSLYLFYNIFVDSNGDEKERRRVWRMGSDTLTGRGNSHGLATTDDDSARTWDAQVDAGEIYGDLSDQRGHLAFFLCLFILLLCMLVFFVCFLYYYYY